MTFGVNKSPFAGQAGKLLTSRQIRDRLEKELETNVAMKIEDTGDADTYLVSGRGLLHLTVLIETMRREGFELMVGPPQVIEKDNNGEREEPFELVDLELPEEYSSSAIDLLNRRKGCMISMSTGNENYVTMQYEVPSRGMNGVKSLLLTASRGLVIMTTTFAGYKPYAGDFPGRDKGNLLSMEQGKVTSMCVENAQARGELFSGPGDDIYVNQIVGIASRPQDLKLNLCKTKKLDNMRAAAAEKNTRLTPPKVMTLEEAVEYISGGEYVEVTPDALRMGVFEQKKR
jgi:GTP-binding protein